MSESHVTLSHNYDPGDSWAVLAQTDKGAPCLDVSFRGITELYVYIQNLQNILFSKCLVNKIIVKLRTTILAMVIKCTIESRLSLSGGKEY